MRKIFFLATGIEKMTSLIKSTRQTPSKYFVSVASLASKIFYNTGTDVAPTMVVVPHAGAAGTGWSTVATLVTAAGTLYRDMGKQVISSGRLFRKVQLLYADGTASTFGVGGSSSAASAATTQAADYYSAYVELPGTDFSGADSNTAFTYAPLARL